MRNILKVLFIVLLTFSACAQSTVFYTDTSKVAFEAADEVLLPGEILTYEVYAFDVSLGDIREQEIENLSLIYSGADIEGFMSIPYPGTWSIAARSKKTTGYGEVLFSDFIYSLNPPPETETEAFVIAPKGTAPKPPTGLKIIIVE